MGRKSEMSPAQRREIVLSTSDRLRAGRACSALQAIGGERALAMRRSLPEPKPVEPPKAPVIEILRTGIRVPQRQRAVGIRGTRR